MPRVNVEGFGVVSFDDTMTTEEITKAIETDILPKASTAAGGYRYGSPAAPKRPDPSPFGAATESVMPVTFAQEALAIAPVVPPRTSLGAPAVDFKLPKPGPTSILPSGAEAPALFGPRPGEQVPVPPAPRPAAPTSMTDILRTAQAPASVAPGASVIPNWQQYPEFQPGGKTSLADFLKLTPTKVVRGFDFQSGKNRLYQVGGGQLIPFAEEDSNGQMVARSQEEISGEKLRRAGVPELFQNPWARIPARGVEGALTALPGGAKIGRALAEAGVQPMERFDVTSPMSWGEHAAAILGDLGVFMAEASAIGPLSGAGKVAEGTSAAMRAGTRGAAALGRLANAPAVGDWVAINLAKLTPKVAATMAEGQAIGVAGAVKHALSQQSIESLISDYVSNFGMGASFGAARGAFPSQNAADWAKRAGTAFLLQEGMAGRLKPSTLDPNSPDYVPPEEFLKSAIMTAAFTRHGAKPRAPIGPGEVRTLEQAQVAPDRIRSAQAKDMTKVWKQWVGKKGTVSWDQEAETWDIDMKGEGTAKIKLATPKEVAEQEQAGRFDRAWVDSHGDRIVKVKPASASDLWRGISRGYAEAQGTAPIIGHEVGVHLGRTLGLISESEWSDLVDLSKKARIRGEVIRDDATGQPVRDPTAWEFARWNEAAAGPPENWRVEEEAVAKLVESKMMGEIDIPASLWGKVKRVISFGRLAPEPEKALKRITSAEILRRTPAEGPAQQARPAPAPPEAPPPSEPGGRPSPYVSPQARAEQTRGGAQMLQPLAPRPFVSPAGAARPRGPVLGESAPLTDLYEEGLAASADRVAQERQAARISAEAARQASEPGAGRETAPWAVQEARRAEEERAALAARIEQVGQAMPSGRREEPGYLAGERAEGPESPARARIQPSAASLEMGAPSQEMVTGSRSLTQPSGVQTSPRRSPVEASTAERYSESPTSANLGSMPDSVPEGETRVQRELEQPVQSVEQLVSMAKSKTPIYRRTLESIAQAINGSVDIRPEALPGERFTWTGENGEQLSGTIKKQKAATGGTLSEIIGDDGKSYSVLIGDGIKKVSRIQQKIQEKRNQGRADYGAKNINDVVGARIIDDPKTNLPKILDLLRRDGYQLAKAYDDKIATPNDFGYRAVHLDLKDADGFIHELQLHFKEGAEIVKSTWQKQADWREIKEKNDGKIPKEMIGDYLKSMEESRAMWDKAMEAYTARTGAAQVQPTRPADVAAGRPSIMEFLESEQGPQFAPSMASGRRVAFPYAELKGDDIPEDVQTAYKLMKIYKMDPGYLFPLYALPKEGRQGFSLGKWFKAEFQRPAITPGGKLLAPRGGIHAVDLPLFLQGKMKTSNGAERVWVEVQMPAFSKDTQGEADNTPLLPNGQRTGITSRLIGPKEAYDYKTNANATGAGSWPIAGSVKPIRILSDAEVAEVLEKAGVGKYIPRSMTGMTQERAAELNSRVLRSGKRERETPWREEFSVPIVPEKPEERSARLEKNLQKLGVEIPPQTFLLHHFQRGLYPEGGAPASVSPEGMGTGVGSGAERYRAGPKKAFWYRAGEGRPLQPTMYKPEVEVTGARAQRYRFDVTRDLTVTRLGTDTASKLFQKLMEVDPELAAKDPYSGGALFKMRGPDRLDRVETILKDMGFDGILGHPEQAGTGDKVMSVFNKMLVDPAMGDKIIDLGMDPEAWDGILRSGIRTDNPEEYAKRIFNFTMKTGGASVHPVTGKTLAYDPGGGFMISLHPERTARVPIETFSREHLLAYLKKNADILTDGDGGMVGTWKNGDYIEMDVVTRLPVSEEEAKRIGYEHEQEAVFNMATMQEVPTGFKRTEASQPQILASGRREDFTDPAGQALADAVLGRDWMGFRPKQAGNAKAGGLFEMFTQPAAWRVSKEEIKAGAPTIAKKITLSAGDKFNLKNKQITWQDANAHYKDRHEKNFAKLDKIFEAVPNPLESVESWNKFLGYVYGGGKVEAFPLPPMQWIEWYQHPERLAQEVNKAYDMGYFGPAMQGAESRREFLELLRTKLSDRQGQELVARNWIWGIFSNGQGAYAHESAFLDSYDLLKPWITAAVEGKFDKQVAKLGKGWRAEKAALEERDAEGEEATAEEPAPTPTGAKKKPKNGWNVYDENGNKVWNTAADSAQEAIATAALRKNIIESFAPTSPARSAINNVRSVVRALYSFSRPGADGRPVIATIADIVKSDKPVDQKRREILAASASSIGTDNKINALILLVPGVDDTLVMDRVMTGSAWGWGPMKGFNLYDTGTKSETTGATGFSKILSGPEGEAIYEALERGMRQILPEAMKDTPVPPTLGNFHWGMWGYFSGQEAWHGILDVLNREALGVKKPLEGAWVKQGKYDQWSSGMEYSRVGGEPMFRYTDPATGKKWILTPEQEKVFASEKHMRAAGVLPEGPFKVKGERRAEAEGATRTERLAPWWEDPGVRKDRIERALLDAGARPAEEVLGKGPGRGQRGKAPAVQEGTVPEQGLAGADAGRRPAGAGGEEDLQPTVLKSGRRLWLSDAERKFGLDTVYEAAEDFLPTAELTKKTGRQRQPQPRMTGFEALDIQRGTIDLAQHAINVRADSDRKEIAKAAGSAFARRPAPFRFAKAGEGKESLKADAADEAMSWAIEIMRSDLTGSQAGLSGVSDAKDAVSFLRSTGDRYNLDMANLIQGGINIVEGKNPELKAILDRISAEMKITGQDAQTVGILKNLIDFYSPRYWTAPGSEPGVLGAGASSKRLLRSPSSAKRRVFDSAFDAVRAGYRPRIRGLSSRRAQMEMDILEAMTTRELVGWGQKAKDAEGTPFLPSRDQIPEQYRDTDLFVELKHPNFFRWRPVASFSVGPLKKAMKALAETVEGVPLNIPQSIDTVRKINPDLADKVEEKLKAMDRGTGGTFVSFDGNTVNVMEKTSLYAPRYWGTYLNRVFTMGDPEAAKTKVGYAWNKSIRVLNAAKRAIFFGGLFHHSTEATAAFGGALKATLLEHKGNVKRMAMEGRELADAMKPEVLWLIENGLTVSRHANWERGQSATLRLTDPSALDRIKRVRQRGEESLFNKYVTGLKVSSAVSMMDQLEAKEVAKKGRALTMDERATIASRVSNMMNNNFGGLHTERMGRSKALSDALGLFLLAKDWTESNLRLLPGFEPLMNKVFEEGKLIRREGVGREEAEKAKFLTKALATVMGTSILANMITDGADDTMERLGAIPKNVAEKGFVSPLLESPLFSVRLNKVYDILGIKREHSEKELLAKPWAHWEDGLKLALALINYGTTLTPFEPKQMPEGEIGRMISGKMSPLASGVTEWLTRRNWQEKPYLTSKDVLKYGRVVKPSQRSEVETMPDAALAWAIDQTMGVVPIPGQSVYQFGTGQTDWLTALLKGLGQKVSEKREPRPRRPERIRYRESKQGPGLYDLFD